MLTSVLFKHLHFCQFFLSITLWVSTAYNYVSRKACLDTRGDPKPHLYKGKVSMWICSVIGFVDEIDTMLSDY